jgi:hypothetical protein
MVLFPFSRKVVFAAWIAESCAPPKHATGDKPNLGPPSTNAYANGHLEVPVLGQGEWLRPAEWCTSRVRDRRGLTFGKYQLVDANTGNLVAGDRHTGFGLSLDQVAERLGYDWP